MVDRTAHERPKRLKVSGDVLRAEAVALVLKRPGAWTLRTLSSYLGRRYHVPPDFVTDQLELSPDFSPSSLQVRRESRAAPVRRTQALAPVRSWDGVVDDVTLWLSEVDADALLVEVTSDSKSRLELRCDFVAPGAKQQIWLSAAASNPRILTAYLAAGPWTLTSPGQLPLVSAPTDLAAPAVLVWRVDTARVAALTLRGVLDDVLGVDVDRVHIERQQCTPADLERRLNDDATVRRLRGRGGSRRAAVSQCDRCGQPLSDPVSVKLGIGPECRRYYSTQVLRRLQSPGVVTSRPESLKEKEWLAVVSPWLRGTAQEL